MSKNNGLCTSLHMDGLSPFLSFAFLFPIPLTSLHRHSPRSPSLLCLLPLSWNFPFPGLSPLLPTLPPFHSSSVPFFLTSRPPPPRPLAASTGYTLTVRGVPCRFPFMYKRLWRHGCTGEDNPKPWCATAVDPGGRIASTGTCVADLGERRRGRNEGKREREGGSLIVFSHFQTC